jgi:hypothetical protein
MPSGGVDDATLRQALDAVGLSELAERLDVPGHWALQLSPGEQQRVAFARALIHKPDWLFLDEATSAVDEATEAHLYRLVRERLAGTTVFSVGHRGTLRPFHTRQLAVQPNGGGPASIVEVMAASTLAQQGYVFDGERCESAACIAQDQMAKEATDAAGQGAGLEPRAMSADAPGHMLSEVVVYTPAPLRCSAERAVRTSRSADPASAASAVRCPIFRPGRGTSLP